MTALFVFVCLFVGILEKILLPKNINELCNEFIVIIVFHAVYLKQFLNVCFRFCCD